MKIKQTKCSTSDSKKKEAMGAKASSTLEERSQAKG
jgi:hypothetical protein